MHTANAMLLLSRLYNYSPRKFYNFIEPFFKQNGEVNLTLQIGMQDKKKNVDTIPDAVIAQDSFKIVVETKLYNNFSLSQLKGHLDDFEDEHYKLLLTLDCEEITDETQNKINEICKDKNIVHKHLTFSSLIDGIREYIDYRDDDFIDVLDDYAAYCDDNGLLPRNQFRVDMRLAGDSLNKNIELGLYYVGVDNDQRIVVENLPYFDNNGDHLHGCIADEIKYIMAESGCGFCFDFSHAICAALNLHKDVETQLKEFFALNPTVYHLYDGNITKEKDIHLHFGKGNFNLSHFLNDFTDKNAYITMETGNGVEQHADKRISDYHYIKSLQQI